MLIVNRVVESITSWVGRVHLKKAGLVAMSALMVMATVLVGARTASADMGQHQSYQRATQTQVCAPQTGETP